MTVPPSTPGHDDQLAFAMRLHGAVLHLMRRIRREDLHFGLSASRMSALSCVAFGTPRTLGELAGMEQVSAPTMTRLVSALERDGYVEKTPDAHDGRVLWIEATERGRRVIEGGRERRSAFLAEHLSGLSEHDRNALRRAIEIMERIYEESR
jgi:DNA-binding MarR family transcriptional regulator